MKCTYKKVEIKSPSKVSSKAPEKKSPAKVDNEEGESSEELAEDSERDDEKKEEYTTKVEFVGMNPFKDLYKCTPLYNFMQEFGQNIVPLSVVGTFLNYVGNHLLHYIKVVMRKKIFHPSHEVTSIQLL